MPSLPTGTITLLFTDIEGSTRIWESHPREMKSALARHDRLIRGAIEANGGRAFRHQGDSFCAAFGTAPSALGGALEAQRALTAEPWTVPGGIRVRMALLTAAAEEQDGDYVGPALNRIARLLSTGYGGQILVSRSTAELVRDLLPPQTSLKALGTHRLKDLMRPEEVFQVLHPGFPPTSPRCDLWTIDVTAFPFSSRRSSGGGKSSRRSRPCCWTRIRASSRSRAREELARRGLRCRRRPISLTASRTVPVSSTCPAWSSHRT